MDNIDISIGKTTLTAYDVNTDVNKPCINIEIVGLKGVSSQELIDLTEKLTEFYQTLNNKIENTKTDLEENIETINIQLSQNILDESNRAKNVENTLSSNLEDLAQTYTTFYNKVQEDFTKYRTKIEQDVIDNNINNKFNLYRTSSNQDLIDEELLSKINDVEGQVEALRTAIIDLYTSIYGGNATSNTNNLPNL